MKQAKEEEKRQRAELKRNRAKELEKMKMIALYKTMVIRPLKKKFIQDDKQTLKENKKSLALAKKNLKKRVNLKTITVAIK